MEFPAFVKLEYQPNPAAKSRFVSDVEATLDAAEKRFGEFSDEAQRLVSSALSMPRNTGGSLDLGADQMRDAAKAQQAIAVAAREVATATATAATEAGDYSRNTRLAVAATEAFAKESEVAAAAALTHAEAVEQVQVVLNRQASATDQVVAANRRGTTQLGAVTNSVRASRFAYVQLGQQMQDVVVQTQMGTNAMQIFTQQVPQAAFALSGLGGKIGTVARFMSGVGGAAIFAGIALAGPFLTSLFKASDASDDLGKKSLSLHDALLKIRDGSDEALKALKDYNAEQDRARDNAASMIKLNLAQAESDIKAAEASRIRLQADLKRANIGPSLGQMGVQGYAGTVGNPAVAAISAAIAENDAALAALGGAARNLRIDDAKRSAEEAADPIKKITDHYDDLADAAIRAAKGNDALSKSLTATLTAYKVSSAADVKNYRDSHHSDSGAASAENNIGTMSALIEQLFPGARITSTTGGKHVANSDHYAGRAIDFVPGGGMGKYSKTEAEQMLENAGVDIRRNAAGVKQFFGPGDKGHSDHFHVAWEGAAPDPDKVKAAFAKAQQAVDDYVSKTGESIARINERFDEQPKLIDQAADATRQLDKIIGDLGEKKPPGFEDLIAQAEHAKQTIQDALVRPFAEMARDAERRRQTDDLILTGHEADAQALQEIWQLEDRIGTLTSAQKDDVTAIVKAQYEHNKALAQAQEMQSAFLDATRSVRDEIEKILSGEGKLSDFKTIFKQLNAKYLTEKIFGGALRDLDQWVKQNTGIKDSVDYLRDQTTDAGNAAKDFAAAVTAATDTIRSGGGSGLVGLGNTGLVGTGDASWAGLIKNLDFTFGGTGAAGTVAGVTGAAANDNDQIVVNGRRAADGIAGMTPDRYFSVMSARIVRPITDALASVVGPGLANAIGGAMSGALSGYAQGGMPGGILGGIKGLVDELGGAGGGFSKALGGGVQGAGTGTMVAGISNALGLKLSTTGSQIGGALGGAIGTAIGGPAGGAIGSLLGAIQWGLIGKLIGGHKTGRVTLDGSGYSVGGTSSKVQGVASQAGDSFLDSLNAVAKQLGGSLGSYGAITLGQRDGKWRVNVGGSGTGALKLSHGAKDFGDDEAAAEAYALQQAIVNGAVKGISQGAQNLLKAGKNLQEQVQKALDFQGVFDQLKAYTDPVGAALDALDKQFDYLKDVFAEAGASAEDYAKLEQLYGIERAKAIKEAADQISGALKSLYDDLTTGDMGLSLRDRKATAQTNYDALATRVRAGDTSAYDDYADAARTLLDIERQLAGSQSDYFDLFNEVKTLTKTTLDHTQTVADASANRDSPFSTTGSAAAAPAVDNQGVIDAVNGLGYKLDALNANLGSAMARVGTSGGPALFDINNLLSGYKQW